MFVKDQVPQLVKLAIGHFLEKNSRELESLWDRVAQESPATALKLYTSLAEFVLPRLSRTQLADAADEPVKIVIEKLEAKSGKLHPETGGSDGDCGGREVEAGNSTQSRH